MKKRKTSITKVTRKAEEILAESKTVSYRSTTLEQLLADFNSRWERLCSLLDDRKKRLNQVSQDQKVHYIVEIITTLETIVIEAERELDRMGEIPDDETRIQEQKMIIQVCVRTDLFPVEFVIFRLIFPPNPPHRLFLWKETEESGENPRSLDRECQRTLVIRCSIQGSNP